MQTNGRDFRRVQCVLRALPNAMRCVQRMTLKASATALAAIKIILEVSEKRPFESTILLVDGAGQRPLVAKEILSFYL